jgi:hypothetical protein
MKTVLRVVAVATVCAAWVQARAQIAPPDAGGAADFGAPVTTTQPPAAGAGSAGGAGAGTAAPGSGGTDSGPLFGGKGPGVYVGVRPGQTITTNAMIGFINAEPVFVNDILEPIDEDLRRVAGSVRTLTEFKQLAGTLIDNQLSLRKFESLIVAAEEAQMTEQDKTRVDMMIALERSNLIANHGGSIPMADRALGARGSNVEKAMTAKRRDLIRELYVQKNLIPRVVMTQQMLRDAYDRDLKRWQQPAQVELYTLTLPITQWLLEPTSNGTKGQVMANSTPEQIKAAEAKALALAKEIVAKLKAGGDFARLVEDYDSHDGARTYGGRVGMINRGSKVNRQEEDFVFSLPANSIGEPLLLHEADFRDSSVVIVKIGKKVEARTVAFTEAQEQLKAELRTAQLRALQEEELKKLARGAAIEGLERMHDVAVDVAVTRYAMK